MLPLTEKILVELFSLMNNNGNMESNSFIERLYGSCQSKEIPEKVFMVLGSPSQETFQKK